MKYPLPVQTATISLQRDRAVRTTITWPRVLVWSWLMSYPFVPVLLAESWKRSGPLTAAMLAWAIAGPVLGWLSLRHASSSRATNAGVVFEAIAATVTPPFFAIFSVVLGLAGWSSYRTYVFYGLLALVVLLSRLAPVAPARQSAAVKRVHYAVAAPLFLFLLAHVFNHLFAIGGYEVHVHMQNALRVVYRNGVVEPLLVTAVIIQVVTGALLVWNARGFHFTAARGLQFVSGAYLSMFFFSHVNAVFVFGRRLQGVDTTFQWATGGPSGLLSSAGSATLLPYYLLSVLAFFVHAACAGRWALVPVAGDRGAERAAWAVGIAGCLVTLALLGPLTGFRLR